MPKEGETLRESATSEPAPVDSERLLHGKPVMDDPQKESGFRGHLRGLFGAATKLSHRSLPTMKAVSTGAVNAYLTTGGSSASHSSAHGSSVRDLPQVGEVGGPMAACGCMPAVSGRSLLNRWRGGDRQESAEDKSLREFFDALLGPGSSWVASRDNETVLHRCLCLEELNAELTSKVCTTGGSEDGGGSHGGRGILHALRPYLEDLITRRQGLRGAVDALAAAADADPELPRVLTELTAKDLFLALLHATPRQGRAALASNYAALRVPLPVVFRGLAPPALSSSPAVAVPGGDGNGVSEIRTFAAFEVLHELACVPRPGRALLLSVGTQKLLGAGKTSLLAALALVPMAEDSLDVRPAGPTHVGSCDLLCADADRWILDMHGSWSGADDELRAAVFVLATMGEMVGLVHCSLGDFHPKSGAMQKDLAGLLSALAAGTSAAAAAAAAAAASCHARGQGSSSTRSGGSPGCLSGPGGLPGLDTVTGLQAAAAAASAASAAATLVANRGPIVLVRDVGVEAWAARSAVVEAALQPYKPCAIIPIDDCRSFRTPARRTAAIDRYRVHVTEALQRVASATSQLQENRSPREQVSDQRSLGGEFIALLDRAHATGAAATTLFPLTAINRQLTALRREEAGIRAGSGGGTSAAVSASSGGTCGASAGGGNTAAAGDVSRRANSRGDHTGRTRMEQLRHDQDQARARVAEIQRLEAELAKTPCSEALDFFRNVVVTAAVDDRLAAYAELALRLESWKEPLVLPLLTRQRELLDLSQRSDSSRTRPPASPCVNRIGASGGYDAKRTGVSDVRDTSGVSGKSCLNAVDMSAAAAQLSELDFSMDSWWAELELHSQRTGVSDFTRERKCWAWLLGNGQPFQVLHSRPLQMGGNFLRSVLEVIGAPQADPRGIFVVSVVGAQSSAKSTLLNFLFGCGFAVRAGRCTRGLYASYFQPGGGRQPMLVLDSEGLLSLSSDGGAFDGQIALMCMTCSHLVLVNHKGELSRQLQDLLEVSLFAMRHLRLARLQPRLVFVLRDQHDRSRSVHEDMLKQMRNHLEDAASTLGTPLEDIILLDGTAVFMLPSAVTSELRNGQEVCWTSELFAREVLQLRGEMFRWLEDDAEHRALSDKSGPLAFRSLAHWYDHASAAWETLVQFGEQLLHYKTIHEIEQRREVADIAKGAVRDALEGVVTIAPLGMGGISSCDSPESRTMGFHARAREVVDSFVSRIHASPTRLDLETTDMELGRALACLRDECVSQLEEAFNQRVSSPRFNVSTKEQAKHNLRTPIEWAFENHLYTWKLHLKKASDERAMHELWVHFTGLLNRHLVNSGHRSCLSEEESRRFFDSEWSTYEASYIARLADLMKDWQTLSHEVTLLFNHAVAKLQHEAGTLALLKEIGPQQVAVAPERRRGAGAASIVEQTDEEWEELYFDVGWWASVRARGMSLLSVSDAGKDGGSGVVGLRGIVIPRMRQVVQQGLQQYFSEVASRGVLDEATAAEGLRHVAGPVLQDMEARMLAECSATLRRPQLLHALNVALRITCVEALVEIEEEKQRSAMTDLHEQMKHVEEHFLLIVQANKGDFEFASNFAGLYNRSLMQWLDHEVVGLAAEVRCQVLQEMPDPQKSSERAYQRSFAARSWPDVLEYVIDMNAYLEKLFLTVFHQKKRAYVESAILRVERRVVSAYRLLQDIAGWWGRKETGGDGNEGTAAATSAAVVKDVVRGPTASVTRSVRDFKDFIMSHAERVPRTADSAEAHRQLAERLPATADFQVADPVLFAEALQARVGDLLEQAEIPKRLEDKLELALQAQSLQAWSLIRGCSERCPLCGSKCDLVGEHSKHHCAHHLFPAFHGWMDRTTGLPSFNHCLHPTSHNDTYECKDGIWRKLEDYLREDHPSWLPFQKAATAEVKDLQHLRAAWVHCREPLLAFFSPMEDSCPKEWLEAHQGEGRPLTKADLDKAKDTIRKLRARRWMPLDE
eukprot:TRINITY_DN40817_c0_g1_i1.p1 TRINITY_DN40817_c0_g1~~TRINITY_DN40817_c0_g1_i1.p1  ORF type:complete len:1965 (-),score=341.65 TRINITY_DN40817_c0_g1_i1:114-6008(-)